MLLTISEVREIIREVLKEARMPDYTKIWMATDKTWWLDQGSSEKTAETTGPFNDLKSVYSYLGPDAIGKFIVDKSAKKWPPIWSPNGQEVKEPEARHSNKSLYFAY